MKEVVFPSTALLLVCFLPIFLLGENSYIMMHDNLDSEFIYLHLLKLTGNLSPFNHSAELPQVFNGLSASYFHSEFSFTRVLFYCFPSFWAYVISSFLIRIIGIIGMCLLIRDYAKDLEIPKKFILLISLSFALLPVYVLYGISVLGQPLLLWSFLNLKSKTKVFLSLFLIFIFPFYAHFAMTAPFLLIALFLLGTYHVLKERKISINYFLGIGILFISFILANYLTLENFVFGEVASHRSEWSKEVPGLAKSLKTFITTMIRGQYHSAVFLGLPVFLLSIYLTIKKETHWRTIGTLLVSIVMISFFYSIYKYISVSLEEVLHLLTSFQFNRFTFLLPLFFYLLLILCFSSFKTRTYLLSAVAILFCLGNMASNKELTHNAAKLVLPHSISKKIPTFGDFYAQDLFAVIKEHIQLPQEEYRVVSLGFHPSVAQYNGFYSLDSYQNNYPLAYKRKFEKVIEGELRKNKELEKYYTNWASRCYLFSAELKESCYLNCKKDSNVSIEELNINTDALKELGGRYILSAVPILNAANIKLTLDRTFENDHSSLKIYLYQL